MAHNTRAPYREPTLRPPATEPGRLPKTALVIAAFVGFGSCCTGALIAWIALLAVTVGVPIVCIAWLAGRRESARRMAVGGALVGVTALLVLALDSRRGAKLALRNESLIIPAVYRFHAEHGRYPDQLQELVPRYLPSTHPAGIPLFGYRTRYWRDDDDAALTVTVTPPFGRRLWRFKNRRRSYLD